MRDLYDAEAAVAAANKHNGEFGHIEPIEYDLRNLNSTPEEVIEEVVIDAWAIDGRQKPLAGVEQMRVRIYADRPTKGTWSPAPSSDYVTVGGGHFDCTKRPFRRITYRPFVDGPNVGRLATTVRLPGLEAGAGDFYRGGTEHDAESALRQLNTEMVPAGPRERARPVQVKWEQVVEPHPSAPAARMIHSQDRSNLRVLTDDAA